ncbi:MAG: META domain-containing protein [Ruminococcaceae bacterium]|nr:META domain-containing protein [Oscillospiraceae bacterium]
MKKVFAIVLSVVMLFALVACAGGSSLAGTEWKLTSMKAEGIEVGAEFLEGLGINGSLTFTDKEVTISAAGESETGTYTVEGNTITMTADGEDMIATIDGNDIIIDMGADGIMTFTKN